MEQALWLDTLSSILAFVGLGSLVVCYLNYRPRWFDYAIFAVLFFIFGWYSGLHPDETTQHQWLTAAAFAFGIVVLVGLKSLYLKKTGRGSVANERQLR